MAKEIYEKRYGRETPKNPAGTSMWKAHNAFGYPVLKRRLDDLEKGNIKKVRTEAESEHFCHLLLNPASKKRRIPRDDGAVQLSSGSKDKKQLNVYWSNWVLYRKVGGSEGIPSEHWSCSHLCHHPDCGNPDHLVLEPLWQNVKRNICPGPEKCTCDDGRGPTFKCIASPKG